MKKIIIFLSAIYCLIGSCISYCMPEYEVTRLTYTSADNTNPQISAGNIIWNGYRDGQEGIWFYNSQNGLYDFFSTDFYLSRSPAECQR